MYWMSISSDILLNSVDCMALHQQFYTTNSVHELFTKGKQENILAFLSAAGLYHLIYIVLVNNIILSRNNGGTFYYLEFLFHKCLLEQIDCVLSYICCLNKKKILIVNMAYAADMA